MNSNISSINKLPLKQSGLRWIWLTLIFLVVDQISKQWVAGSMELYQSINILPFFNLF